MKRTEGKTHIRVQKNIFPRSAGGAVVIFLFFGLCLITVHARENSSPIIIETFTLDQSRSSREFFSGKLKIELVSSISNEFMKTIIIRVSSDALRAEYGNDWHAHTYIEMTRNYVGDPVSGSPFKCLEGWFYYINSSPGSVTLALYEGSAPVGSAWYTLTVKVLGNWQYFIKVLCLIALAVFLYYYIPLLWSFIHIQILARSFALETGFESYPVWVYLINKLPLLACICLFFHLLFNFDWKGVAAAMVVAVGLQVYLNRHNRKQLVTYAAKKHLAPVEGFANNAFMGRVNNMPVTLTVGGTFVSSPFDQGDFHSNGYYVSYLVIQVSLKSEMWNGLALERNNLKPWGWGASQDISHCARAGTSLEALAKLPRYCIGSIEVAGDILMAVKAFAPDSPAEIHLLVDLITELAASLNSVSER